MNKKTSKPSAADSLIDKRNKLSQSDKNYEFAHLDAQIAQIILKEEIKVPLKRFYMYIFLVCPSLTK